MTTFLSSVGCVEMAIFDASTLSGSYQVLNGAAQQTVTGSIGFEEPVRILQMYNDGTTGVIISLDGIKPSFYMPSKATLIVDAQTNANANMNGSGTKQFRKGQLIYGKGTASDAGLNIYISGYA